MLFALHCPHVVQAFSLRRSSFSLWVLAATLGLLASGKGLPTASATGGEGQPTSPPPTSPTVALVEGIAIDPADMDLSVKPGDDFYHYAGGTWLKRNLIPPDQTRWGSFFILYDHTTGVLHDIFEECAAAATRGNGDAPPGSIQRKVGDFYASGMDEATINAAGTQPLAPYLEQINVLQDTAGLPLLLAKLQQVSMGALFNLDVGIDEKNSGLNIVRLSQGGLGLPDRDYYLLEDDRTKTLRQQYEQHLTKMFTLLGDPADQAASEAKTVFAFETALAKVSKTRVERRDPEGNYHKMTLEELSKVAPDFEWRTYFTALGAPEPGGMDVGQPEFIAAAVRLAARTPTDDLKTYLRWQLLHKAAPYLSQTFVDEDFAYFHKTLFGQSENEPRWKQVTQVTSREFGQGVGQLYVAKTFSPEARARALAEVHDLMAALRGKLTALDWMGAETRAAALDKLDHMNIKVGYPDQWRDYSKLEIKRQPYVLNVLAAKAFEVERDLAKINQPVDKGEWNAPPQLTDAYYRPARNEIVLPAAILQPPFFNAVADDAVNYGGIGAVIGHEMTHGFDDQGRQYNAQGNLRNWWTEEDRQYFEERANRIVKQFYGYEIAPGEHVNGKLTEGENIADLGGLKVAYAALEKALDCQGADAREKKIDGFTPEQRFFLGYAQVWRGNVRPETQRQLLKLDPHSPWQFRCNGPLSNLPEFQQAFDIPDGAPMVRPADARSQIW